MIKGSSKATRRDIIKGAGLATVSSMFWYPSGKVLGANDRVNLAVIGMRGQGGSHVSPFGKIAGVHIKTLCDIDENVSAKKAADVEKEFNYKAEQVWDMRRVFDDKDIHAVTIATPNHWHALASIWAAQAGKHVYVEKPACHTVWEGRQMVNAARKYKTLMQVGFQNRSRRNTIAAMKFIHGGGIGKVFRARGLCYKRRGNIGRYPDGPMTGGQFTTAVPAGQNLRVAFTAAYLEKVHYDNWIGPATKRPFNPNRFHYNWHWQFEYGGGDTANQGPHQFDVARWGLKRDDGPVKVRSFGGLYAYTDSQQDTPNEQLSVFEYADGTILEFETRGLPTNAEGMHVRRGGSQLPKTAEELQERSKNSGILIGDIFYGEKGRLEIDDSGRWTAFDHDDKVIADSANIKEEESDARVLTGAGSGGHYGNFIAAVKSGKQADLTCDIEEGFRSTILPLIANVSYRVGRELKWDGKREQFVGDAAANKLLKRNDRKGFVVPNLGNGSA